MYAFIDESGDHSLDLNNPKEKYNIFVLGVALISKKDYPSIDAEFKAIKKEFFGSDDFIIHTWELTHPLHKKADPRNRVMRIEDRRYAFYERINNFLLKSPIRAIFCVIRKPLHKDKYTYPIDPYDLSFENILNRILYYSNSNEIEILPECRSKELDLRMAGEFAKYSTAGTRFHSPEEIKSRISKFECQDKKLNYSGHQITDLLSTPVGRHFLGFSPKPKGNEVPFSVVKSKLNGNLALTIFP